MSNQQPFFFVMNPGSGNQNAQQTQDTISAILSAAGCRYQFMVVEEGSQLITAAQQAVKLAQEQAGAVVAVGGDGTLNTVSQAVLGTGVPFGVLPQGTSNYFARCEGIPQDTDAATQWLIEAVIKPVNVGKLNGKIFLVNASLGLYPQLLEDREAFKQRFGRNRLVALGAALMTLLKAHRQLAVQIEYAGEIRTLRTPTIVVNNNALQLEHIGIDKGDELARNHLVAITSTPVSTPALYGMLLRGLLSRLGEDENLISFSFEKMTVRLGRGRRRIKVAMDGEVSYMRSPLEFSVAEHRLPLLVPRDPALRSQS